MTDSNKFYINGQWVAPINGLRTIPVVNPSTEEQVGTVAMADAADVDAAVKAAHDAFPSFSRLPLSRRIGYMKSILEIYERRSDDLAAAITREMGAPLETISKPVQSQLGVWHLQTAIAAAEAFEWHETLGQTIVVKEPIGVCALITPWNWPLNQIMVKVAPAIATGCTMVLKPSEMCPANAQILAEILDEAELPKGVFNLIHGDGAEIGPVLSSHPLVDMVSLTGSQRAGASVSKNAADTIKRVSLELGGKSANIILPGADLAEAVQAGVGGMMLNTGQSCNAPSRMFVHRSELKQAEEIAKSVAEQVVVGDATNAETTMGPSANSRQYERVQALIQKGIDEGAKVVIGGTGRPEGLDKGYYVRPTIFSEATNDMVIAREEIFGPVLTIIPYDTEEEAIAMANDTNYGLSGYVSAGTVEKAREVASQLRTGMVHLNGAQFDLAAPFGGYKQSGNGREWGSAGFEEFLETKAIMGVA